MPDWNGDVYIAATDDFMRDFALEQGTLKLRRMGSARLSDPGATPSVSANGSKNGIVWTLSSKHWDEPDRPPAVLRAWDAADVTRELYSSEQNAGRDRAGVGLRFVIPMVANGRVYVAAKGEVDVYGLLAPPR